MQVSLFLVLRYTISCATLLYSALRHLEICHVCKQIEYRTSKETHKANSSERQVPLNDCQRFAVFFPNPLVRSAVCRCPAAGTCTYCRSNKRQMLIDLLVCVTPQPNSYTINSMHSIMQIMPCHWFSSSARRFSNSVSEPKPRIPLNLPPEGSISSRVSRPICWIHVVNSSKSSHAFARKCPK